MSLKELLAAQRQALASSTDGFAGYCAQRDEKWWNGFWVFARVPPSVAAASAHAATQRAAESPIKADKAASAAATGPDADHDAETQRRRTTKHMLAGLEDCRVWLQQGDATGGAPPTLEGLVYDGTATYELRPTALSASRMLCDGAALHDARTGSLLSPLSLKLGYGRNAIAAAFNWTLRVDGGTVAAAEEVTLVRAFPRLLALSTSYAQIESTALLARAPTSPGADDRSSSRTSGTRSGLGAVAAANGDAAGEAGHAADDGDAAEQRRLAAGRLATMVVERCPSHFQLAPVVATSAGAVTRLLGVPAASAADRCVGGVDADVAKTAAHVATVPLDAFRELAAAGPLRPPPADADAGGAVHALNLHGVEFNGGAWGVDLAEVHAETRAHARLLLLPTPSAREQAQLHASRYHHGTAHLHVEVIAQPAPPVQRSEAGVATAPPAQPALLAVRPPVWRERHVEGTRRVDGIVRVQVQRGHDGALPEVTAAHWGPAAAAALADDLLSRLSAPAAP